ncbi:hypothetical protein IZ6_08300 [Terrihabitans soli]|uniref:Uncharacterized protein n=1 Tax=Terrihabitans soli TaxID=708113 RepID=A0A6S6QQQ4_9HYPH|nr:DUF6111 family protein [Terrihabitans soli]BCJ90095.1 hypothetical protein IZ6_08300 [Terrihabitans soli]
MIRSILPAIVLFLLPFAVYFLWLGLKRRSVAGTEIPVSGKYLAWATGLGMLLAAGAFVIFGDFRGADPDAVYFPPVYEGGKVTPGHFEPREKAK